MPITSKFKFNFSFQSFTLILMIATIFMIAGLYLWIVFGFTAATDALQIVEEQNRELNKLQVKIEGSVLQNQHLIIAYIIANPNNTPTTGNFTTVIDHNGIAHVGTQNILNLTHTDRDILKYKSNLTDAQRRLLSILTVPK